MPKLFGGHGDPLSHLDYLGFIQGLYRGYFGIGILEKKMEATIMGYIELVCVNRFGRIGLEYGVSCS